MLITPRLVTVLAAALAAGSARERSTVRLKADTTIARSVRPQPDVVSPRPEPVVDNGEFMDLFLKSTYGELQEAMVKPPADRKAWATIYQRAIRLAEMQNLLFFRDRDEVKDPRWGALTAGGRQAAADLANAALFGLRNLQKADYQGVRKKYLALVDACNACHRTFARDAPTVKP